MTRHFHRQAILSIADQAVFSGAMLVLNILLARWTSPEEYGAFAVTFAIFLILAGLHNAVVIEPMSVFGPRKETGARLAYLRHVYLIHGAFAVVLVVAALAPVVWLSDDSLQLARWALPLTIPLTMTFWLVRRTCYVEARPGQALGMSTLYAILLVTALYWLYTSQSLSSFSAFIAFGISGFVVSLPKLILVIRGPDSREKESFIESLRKHAKYGRWSLGESIAFALGASILPLVIAWFMSVGEAGKFRAMQILFLPLTHLTTGLGLMLLPAMSRLRATGGNDQFVARAKMLLLAFIALAVIYALPLLTLGDELLMVIYGSVDYLEFLPLLPYLALNGIAAAGVAALMIVARSSERPDLVFIATVAGSGVMLTAGIAAIATFGMSGIAAALLLNTGVTALVLALRSRRLFYQSRHTLSRHAHESANV